MKIKIDEYINNANIDEKKNVSETAYAPPIKNNKGHKIEIDPP